MSRKLHDGTDADAGQVAWRKAPPEEQLRQLADLPENQPWPAAQQSQTEQHLQQLIARYALMKQKTAE
ncbi:VasL domain-containing protein [Enterobacter cloacae]